MPHIFLVIFTDVMSMLINNFTNEYIAFIVHRRGMVVNIMLDCVHKKYKCIAAK